MQGLTTRRVYPCASAACLLLVLRSAVRSENRQERCCCGGCTFECGCMQGLHAKISHQLIACPDNAVQLAKVHAQRVVYQADHRPVPPPHDTTRLALFVCVFRARAVASRRRSRPCSSGTSRRTERWQGRGLSTSRTATVRSQRARRRKRPTSPSRLTTTTWWLSSPEMSVAAPHHPRCAAYPRAVASACSVTLTLDNDDDDDVMALVVLEASRRTQSPRSVVVALRMCACVALPPPIGLPLSFVFGMHSRC
jgi:hypothetical protein